MRLAAIIMLLVTPQIKGPILIQKEPIGVQRQIELWKIEHADDQDRRCMPGHVWDRCHSIPIQI
jgi:hypothetical protein